MTTVQNLRLHNENGTLNGSYVYTLICQDEGPLYIKLGTSINPLRRFQEIRGGNPIHPITLAWINLASKDLARQCEVDLQCGCEQWHHSLEWFLVHPGDFPDFRQRCKEVLERYQNPARPRLKWNHVGAQELIKQGHGKRAKALKIYKSRGAAYAHFLADGGAVKSKWD